MGINKKAADDFDAILLAFKAANSPNRTQRRKYVAAIYNRAAEWLVNFDAQDNAALADFAASKQAQFNAFVDALVDPPLSSVDPNA